jgi:anti-sigma factor RsiW
VTCPVTASSLGAYVLGALEPDERRRFEEHLEHCAFCTAELAEFAAVLSLLDQVRPEDLQPVAVTPSPGLFERVSAAARASRQPERRRRRWLLAAAAAVVLLGGGAGAVVWAANQGSDTVTASSGTVRATLAADGQGDGTALDVAVAGLRPGETCRMVAVDEDGGHHDAGEWSVSDDGDGRWRGWADVERESLREVVLYGDGDRELVRLEL